MIISISNVIDGYIGTDRANMTLDQSELVTGDIKVCFSGESGNKSEEYEKRFVNIPLAISETFIFLDRTILHGCDTWKMYFTPFVDGHVEGSDLVITRGVKGGGTKVLERLSPEKIRETKKTLKQFARRFGCLKPSPDAISRQR